MTTAHATESSSFAPFRRKAFLWLWLGVMVSSVGGWAQMVGAQWLFVNDPNAATIVALVQTASTLPVMLLALPAGVLADAFDRRWLLFGVELYMIVVSILLATLTFLGQMPPLLLLGFTFAIGVGMAVLIPTWQPLITELVPREQLAAATRLDMVSVNLSRAAGPAIAGFLIAQAGVPVVFAFNAGCAVLLVVVLLVWRRQRPEFGRRERFLPALRAGGRYVRHEPVVRRIIIRLIIFVAPATALWALLPLIASRQLGLDSSGYGVLFAALGVGAVAGALTLGRVKRVLSSNAVVGLSAVIFALGLAAVMVVGSLWLAIPLLLLAGYGWTATASTLVSELQLFLPGWVRARALAVYMMAFTGSQAIVSPLWGLLTQFAGLPTAIWTASALVALTAVAGVWLRVPESGGEDRSPVAYWGEAPLIEDPAEVGPVAVRVEYQVSPEEEDHFVDAMQDMRRSRLRSGALRWELFRVAEQPQTFIEHFTVGSWEEHLHMHATRMTAEDQAIEERAFSFTTTAPVGRHLIPPSARLIPPEGRHD